MMEEPKIRQWNYSNSPEALREEAALIQWSQHQHKNHTCQHSITERVFSRRNCHPLDPSHPPIFASVTLETIVGVNSKHPKFSIPVISHGIFGRQKFLDLVLSTRKLLWKQRNLDIWSIKASNRTRHNYWKLLIINILQRTRFCFMKPQPYYTRWVNNLMGRKIKFKIHDAVIFLIAELHIEISQVEIVCHLEVHIFKEA